MVSFALISEGVTDQIILERLIRCACADVFGDDIYVNPLQPLRGAKDAKTAPHGGWQLVLEYCEKRASDALAANDYVVIHVDTDQGEHPDFGVSLTENGADRPYNDIISDSVAALVARLGEASHVDYFHRLIFAIAVHSMESWILLCLYNKDQPKNSFVRLNRHLRKTGERPLTKDHRRYQEIARLIECAAVVKLTAKNHSLGVFLTSLRSLAVGGIEDA